MIQREMREKVIDLARKYPIISVTGPRQSGKTTLVRAAFQDYEYLSMEDPDVRLEFGDDPRLFLSRHNDKVIFDEAQRAPELFSYLQGIVEFTGKTAVSALEYGEAVEYSLYSGFPLRVSASVVFFVVQICQDSTNGFRLAADAVYSIFVA